VSIRSRFLRQGRVELGLWSPRFVFSAWGGRITRPRKRAGMTRRSVSVSASASARPAGTGVGRGGTDNRKLRLRVRRVPRRREGITSLTRSRAQAGSSYEEAYVSSEIDSDREEAGSGGSAGSGVGIAGSRQAAPPAMRVSVGGARARRRLLFTVELFTLANEEGSAKPQRELVLGNQRAAGGMGTRAQKCRCRRCWYWRWCRH
jgi:hypothetical protein